MEGLMGVVKILQVNLMIYYLRDFFYKKTKLRNSFVFGINIPLKDLKHTVYKEQPTYFCLDFRPTYITKSHYEY